MEEAEEKKGKRGHHPDNNRRAKVTEIGPDQEFENDEVIASIEVIRSKKQLTVLLLLRK
ncbi:hypothetical protein AG4045_016887 [Apium graveolens]|uniref:Uncharacterized protein n=1 Tax=Apium graveolens TaxID=4045 RepID=A0A6L5BA72_APIGR|nr:hypothetical protein AG4045_016887 [Apium graveolens]